MALNLDQDLESFWNETFPHVLPDLPDPDAAGGSQPLALELDTSSGDNAIGCDLQTEEPVEQQTLGPQQVNFYGLEETPHVSFTSNWRIHKS